MKSRNRIEWMIRALKKQIKSIEEDVKDESSVYYQTLSQVHKIEMLERVLNEHYIDEDVLTAIKGFNLLANAHKFPVHPDAYKWQEQKDILTWVKESDNYHMIQTYKREGREFGTIVLNLQNVTIKE